ncbi:MAG: dihydrodipicolinate synthase family protein [Planctomycetales bacterium]|nr:dihydrodipicolinate synthase family protein [Planctomycetales bacterium]
MNTAPGMPAIPAIRPGRKIVGMSAILLPLIENDCVDWNGFRNHVERTLAAGLVPAVNMDTGFANLIDEETRRAVLRETQAICAGSRFVAGAFVGSQPGDAYDAEQYLAQIDSIQEHSGTPVIFQSFGLTGLADQELIAAYQQLGKRTQQFIAFELGQMFAPFGKIYSLDVYRELIQIPECMGAKHSSLERALEWKRLEIRDAVRPEFLVLTGNDLAIDMVMYGSDYLLGLSTMAPDLFGLRDQMWADGNAEFYQLNDLLQYMGFFAFRAPVPAYKHTAAQFLKLRNWIANDCTFPGSPGRPDSDVAILNTLLDQCSKYIQMG